jgi:exopolyphosphatase / guanosine-5'-triphosphate,3'-diphosphate pyrophosphatase
MDKEMIGGVIDVGTNSVKCLAARTHPLERMETLLYTRKITGLGKGLGKKGSLLSESMKKTADVIEDYVKQLREMDVEEIVVIGTYALRTASNTSEFLQMVRDKTGLDIEILSGDEEAEYTTLGALLDIDERTPARITIMDIGGGSTEITGGDFAKSLPVGALSVSEKFLESDPPTPGELKQAFDYLLNLFRREITGIKEKELVRGVGVGGTIMSAAALKKQLDKFDFDKIHLTTLNSEEIESFINKLYPVTTEHRRSLLPFDPDRADTIVGGLLIVRAFFNYFDVDRFTVSLKSLVHGIFYKKFVHRV